MVRRTPAEVNAALAGVTLVAPFARFKVPMAMFSEESASCCPWVSVAMVETTRKRCGVQAVRKSPRLIETGVHLDIARLVQPGPFGEEDYLTVAFEDVASDHPLNLGPEAEVLDLSRGFPDRDHETHIPLPRRSAGSPRTSGSPSRGHKGLHTIAYQYGTAWSDQTLDSELRPCTVGTTL